jgi:hypothetical protein
MTAFNFYRRKTRRRWAAGATLMVAACFTVFFVVGASAHLTGSTFGGGDGNLTCNDANGTTDWNCLGIFDATTNPTGINVGIDRASGTGDNSFGQGTKENNSNVTVVSGSIPPNKSNLTRFYEASELGSNGHAYLYLGWERTNVLGNANMDFEIEQSGNTACPGGPGSCTLSRTTGDILVTYDFAGGGTPTIGIRTWSGSAWVPDTTTVVSESAVNSGTVSDGVAPSSGLRCPNSGQCPAGTFGEAAIDLTDSGFSQSDLCKFGQASTFLKSRSSSSFTSEVKDFISPVKTPVANLCGTITITKVTDPAAADQDFGYTATGGLDPASFSLNAAAPSGGNSDSITYTNVTPGDYTVDETTIPSGWAFGSLDCTATGTGTSETNNGSEADITLGNNGNVSCTYTNNQTTGAISIHKVDTKDNAVGGASFTATASDGTTVYNFPDTDSNGDACVANLPFDTYTVAETSAPAGYAADAGSQEVTVNSAGDCTSGATAAASDFVDTPLSDIQVNFADEGSGKTSATISCDNADGTPDTTAISGWNSSLTVTGISAPTTVTCTITIDP